MEKKYSLHVPLKFWFNTDIEFIYSVQKPKLIHVEFRNLDLVWQDQNIHNENYLRTRAIG
jgi:hypothetical protein